MTEAMVFTILMRALVVWVVMVILDVWFNITTVGVVSWYKVLGGFLVVLDVVGWVAFGLYKLWMM